MFGIIIDLILNEGIYYGYIFIFDDDEKFIVF